MYEVLLKCDEAQRERWLLPCVQGERTCSIAITEPNAGSDAVAIKTRAVKDGDGWRLYRREDVSSVTASIPISLSFQP